MRAAAIFSNMDKSLHTKRFASTTHEKIEQLRDYRHEVETKK